MSKRTFITQFCATAALAVSVTSCSLHSRQEWAKIQEHGLFPYLASKRDSSPRSNHPSPASVTGPKQMLANSSQSTATNKPQTSAYAPLSNPTTSPAVAKNLPRQSISLPPPSEMSTESLPVATLVPGLEGYVRTPYTDPPRLVDVRGTSAGEKVVCPFTRKPFLVPTSSMNTDSAAVASTSLEPAAGSTIEPTNPLPSGQATDPSAGVNNFSPQIPQISADLSTPSLAQLNDSTPLPTVPTQMAKKKVMATDAPPPPVVDNTPPANPQSNAPLPETKANNSTAPAGSKAEAGNAITEMPYGNAIVGRPGFVNSPYAAKHQLVDVTGLPTGMEVKCPYSGKLFRVPPMANGQ